MNQRVWYVYTHRSDGLRREITYAGTWRWGRWRFRGVGSFPTLTAAQMSDPYDIARRIWGSYEHGDGAADDVRSVQEDAWEEGWNACAEWWEIHHHEDVRDEQNPHRGVA